MSKGMKTFLLVLVSIVVVSVLIVGIFTAASISSIKKLLGQGGTVSSNRTDYEEAWVLPFAENAILDIDLIAVDATIMPHDGEDIAVSFAGSRSANMAGDLPYIRAAYSGGRFKIEEKYPEGAFGLQVGNIGASMQGTLTVKVPKKAFKEIVCSLVSGSLRGEDLEAGVVSVDTTSGAVELYSIQASGRVRVDSVSGSQTLNDVRAGDVRMGSTSGTLQVENLEADALDISCTSGDMRLENIALEKNAAFDSTSGALRASAFAAKTIQVSNTSGGVRMEETKAEEVRVDTTSGTCNIDLVAAAEVHIDTASGNVQIALPKDAAFAFALETVSGNVRMDFPARIENKEGGRYLSGTVGEAGSSTLRVQTTSGGIRVTER